jgi:hypothetical protein
MHPFVCHRRTDEKQHCRRAIECQSKCQLQSGFGSALRVSEPSTETVAWRCGPESVSVSAGQISQRGGGRSHLVSGSSAYRHGHQHQSTWRSRAPVLPAFGCVHGLRWPPQLWPRNDHVGSAACGHVASNAAMEDLEEAVLDMEAMVQIDTRCLCLFLV